MIHPTQIQDMLQAALETGGDFAEVFVRIVPMDNWA